MFYVFRVFKSHSKNQIKPPNTGSGKVHVLVRSFSPLLRPSEFFRREWTEVSVHLRTLGRPLLSRALVERSLVEIISMMWIVVFGWPHCITHPDAHTPWGGQSRFPRCVNQKCELEVVTGIELSLWSLWREAKKYGSAPVLRTQMSSRNQCAGPSVLRTVEK